jgi:trk system potassium uptake protein TrkH
MRPHIVFRYTGLVLLLNAVFMFLSCVVSLLKSDTALFPLLYSGMISALFGLFPILFVPPTKEISSREGLTIVVASWLLACLVGTIPYILWGGEFTFTNAWFESVSGFTTTGSSILSNIEAVPPGLLFWRASTHWIGGIGIIIFVLALIPTMGKAGLVLYRTEMTSLAAENFHYRTQRTLQILVFVYVGLTLAETAGLLFCGMDLFDALTHAFATVATGGFSPRNLSVAYYKSVAVEVVIMVFMVLSGMHFGLLFLAFQGRLRDLWESLVVRYYLSALVVGVLVTAWSVHAKQYPHWAEALRYAAFQVISIGTSTGFATADSNVWPPLAQLTLIFFTLQCACAGSTSGGIKTDRMVIFWKSFVKRINKIRHPRAVITPKLDGLLLDGEILETNLLYIALYMMIVFLSTAALTAFNVDLLTAFTGSATAMGNVGPGFGAVGSMSNFSQIPNAGKWILSATMLLGRLEIFGLILFLTVKSWR